MPNYRKVNAFNLVVGIILILVAVGGLISLVNRNISGLDLLGPMILVLFFVFLGGYEIGKYVENQLGKQREN
jgi:hypothetical protein